MKTSMLSQKQQYKFLLLLTILPVLLNINILSGDFQFDDSVFIVSGEHSNKIKDMGLLLDFWRHGGYSQRFVHWATLAMNYQLGKLNPFGYHLVNILIHVLNGVLIFFLCQRLVPLLAGGVGVKVPARKNTAFLFSFLSALAFLILPIQTETIAYISSRSASLVTFFYLFGAFFFLKFLVLKIEGLALKKWIFPVFGIVVCAILGFGTKMTFFTFPCILFLIYYFHSRLSLAPFIKKHKALLASMLLITLSLFFIKIAVFYEDYQKQKGYWEEEFSKERQKGLVDSRPEFIFKNGIYSVFGIREGYNPEMYSPLNYAFTEVHVVSKYYLRKIFFPFELNLSPDVPIEKGMRLGTVITVLGMALAVYAVWRISGQQPLLLLSLLWFFVALLPTSSFIPLFDVASEHRTYIASPGAAMLLGFILCGISSKIPHYKTFYLRVPVVLAIFIYFSTAWMDRNSDWQTEMGLWSDAARKSPNMGRTHHNLGLAYERRNLFSEALLEYNKSLAIQPAPDTYVNIAQLNIKLGFIKKAIQDLHTAIEMEPKMALAHYNLGVLYHDMGKWREAIDAYKTAISCSQNYTEAFNNLGEIYVKQNQLAEAREYFEKALSIKPFHFESLNNLATLYQQKGDFDNAGLFYHKAIESNPLSPEARFNFGTLCLEQGKPDEAEVQLREAIRLKPKFESALATLGDTLLQKKLFGEAARTYQAALELKADNPIIHRNLGIIYYEHLHDNQKALFHFKKTLGLAPKQDFAESIQAIIKKLEISIINGGRTE